MKAGGNLAEALITIISMVTAVSSSGLCVFDLPTRNFILVDAVMFQYYDTVCADSYTFFAHVLISNCLL